MNDYENIKKSKTIALNILRIMKKEDDGSSQKTVQELLNGNRDAKRFIEDMSNDVYLSDAVANYTNPNKQECVERLLVKMNRKRQQNRRRLRYAISSIAAILAAVSFLLFENNRPTHEVKNELKNENSAVLIFEDGSQLSLNSDRKEHKKDLIIENRTINYTNDIANDKEEFHTLITPSRCTYTLILSDSTEIVLNAGSKIRYPKKVGNSRREVYLEGEAFFNVTKSEQPFIVASKDFNIQVYGTTFNVNVSKKNISETVLLSGSIGITLKKGDKSEIMVRPNQLFTLENQSGNYHIKEVDCSQYIGWINGSFTVDNVKLSSLLDDLSRWYGIEYHFANPALSNIIVSADIAMNLEVEQVNSIVASLINRVIINEGNGKYMIK